MYKRQFLGLAISAVGLPIAGVVAVARAQGLEKLAGRVHPVFAPVSYTHLSEEAASLEAAEPETAELALPPQAARHSARLNASSSDTNFFMMSSFFPQGCRSPHGNRCRPCNEKFYKANLQKYLLCAS